MKTFLRTNWPLAVMSIVYSVACILILSACAGEGTGPQGAMQPNALVVVAGNGQTGEVTKQLPEAVEVVAGITPSGYRVSARLVGNANSVGTDTTVSNITPIPGAIVNFVVPDSGCGHPFAGSALTDSTGHAKEVWTLGTRATLCAMQARMVDQKTGEPLVIDTIFATVLPGPAQTIYMNMQDYLGGTKDSGIPVAVGDSLDLRSRVDSIVDAYSNHIHVDTLLVSVQDSTYQDDDVTSWTWTRSNTVTFPTAGAWRAYVKVGNTLSFVWVRVQ